MRLLSCLFAVLVAFATAAPALAAGVEDILGPWSMVTVMPNGENESTVVFSLDGDTLVAELKGRGGSLPAIDPKYEDGQVSWGLKVPQLQNQVVITTVTINGDTFEGAVKTPIGPMAVRGKRVDEEALEAAKGTESELIGDWTLYTEFQGEPIITKFRIFMNDGEGDDQGLAGVVMGRGGQIFVRRIRVEDGRIEFRIMQPFTSDEPAVVRGKLDGAKFEGTVKMAFGEMPISGEMIDTSKMVLAPYDDPKPVLGDWEGTAVIDGEEHAVSINVFEEENRLHAKVVGADFAFDADEVDYEQVNDTMGVLRITVAVPDLGSDPQVFELIVDGDTIDGEELQSNGARTLTGKRKS